MKKIDSVVAVFADHNAAETAIGKLAQDGYAMKDLSVIGKGYHTEEKVVGFYNIGDRVKFWGLRGAFWGGLWGLFLGCVFVTTPVIGNVVVLGYLATVIIDTIDSALVVGAFSALGAAIYSIGVPHDSVVQYEKVIKADGFLVMAHGSVDEVLRAKEILATANPSELNMHFYEKPLKRVGQLAYSEHDRT
jgi:hypothetical protein